MDPYKILGIEPNASADDIKTAYRKLASKHHPDRGGDTKTFQNIQQAYDMLTDPNRRNQFEFQAHQHDMFGNFGNPHTFFHDFVNQFTRQAQQKIYTVQVFLTLEQIAKNKKETVQLNTGVDTSVIEIDIPPGVEDGSQFRYNQIMKDGWLQITFRIYRHQKFEKHGLDLYCTQDIDFMKLITGAKLNVVDILGNTLEINVAPMTKPGTKLRIAGKGLPGPNGFKGDQYVLLNGTLPDTLSEPLLNLIKQEYK